MPRMIAMIVLAMLAMFASSSAAQFAPGSSGDAASKQACEAADDVGCAKKPETALAQTAAGPVAPDLSKLAPNSPETAEFARNCEIGDMAQCHYLAQVLDRFIRSYSERRIMYKCSDPASRRAACNQLDAISKEVVSLISPAGKAYAKACEGSIDVACVEGARLELSIGQEGGVNRAIDLLYAGCARDNVPSCLELTGLRSKASVDVQSARLAAGKLCVLIAQPIACYEFGQALASGIGGPANLPAARDAYARGCEEPGNNADACWSYAGMLKFGRGGPVDRAGAREAYLKYCRLKQTKRCVAADEIKL